MRDYYSDIPIGKTNAISREALTALWGTRDRRTREIVQELRNQDNGDDYIIVSDSKGSGYFRSNDPETIRAYVNETQKRAVNTLLPLQKAKRILRKHADESKQTKVGAIVCKLHDYRDGFITQTKLVQQMQKKFPSFDRVSLSKAENGLIVLPPEELTEIARLLDITPRHIYPSMLTEYQTILEDC